MNDEKQTIDRLAAQRDAEVGYAFGMVLGATVFDAKLKSALLKWADGERAQERRERRRIKDRQRRASCGAPGEET